MPAARPQLTEVKAMDRTVIEVSGISEGIRKAGVPLSPAVRANGFVFVSGTPPIDLATGNFVKGDIARQTEQCLRCLQHVLESAGSSLAKVCKVVIYATDSTQFARINEVYAGFFRKRRRRAASWRWAAGRWISISRSNASPWRDAGRFLGPAGVTALGRVIP
jgi:2-iminobutanoate/2-iminopropanoate deaminase